MLSNNFIDELFRLCLLSERVLVLCNKYLEFHYLPNDDYKDLWREIRSHYNLFNRIPTIGILSQKKTDSGYLALLEKIKRTDVRDAKDEIIDEFEKFLKDSKAKEITVQLVDYYNEENYSKAFEYLIDSSTELANFSIKDKILDRVFAEYKIRQEIRDKAENAGRVVIPTGIPQLDYDIRGGIEKGTGLLITARSGVGKSTLLKWIALTASKLGYKVLHFQAEGARKNTMDSFDSAFSGILLEDIKRNKEIDERTKRRIEMALDAQLASSGEIIVKSFEQFTKPSILECREILKDVIKAEGHIDLVIFDYLDLFNPDNGKYANNKDGEKRRKTETARKVINVATEFNVAVAAATQANNILREFWNNPSEVITREHIANDKEAIQPFRYHITLNQTEDEMLNYIMRIYEDKLTDFAQMGVFKIYQDLPRHRFVDTVRTYERFWDHATKRRRL